MDILKRTLSLLLAMVLILGMVPVNALAAEETVQVTAPVETTAATEETAAAAIPVETMEATLPETTVPEETAAPEETVAETTMPQETEPAQTVPETTAPEETLIPEETEADLTEDEATVPAVEAAAYETEQYLQDQIDSGSSAWADRDIVLENDFTFPEGERLYVQQGITLTVPSGKTLTLESASIFGRIQVEAGGSLIVNNPVTILDGGVIRVEPEGRLCLLEDYITCYIDGQLDIAGTFEATAYDGDPIKIYRSYEKGKFAVVNGVPESYQRLDAFVYSESELQQYVALQENHDFWRYLAGIEGSFTLNEDITIPDDYYVMVNSGNSLTIGADCTLTNRCSFSTRDGIVCNDGVIQNYGSWTVASEMTNNGVINMYRGKLTVESGKVFQNNGTVYAYPNSNYSILGTWNGNERIPVTQTQSEQYLQDQIDSGSKAIVAEMDVVLENDFVLPNGVQLNLYSGCTLTVPSGKTLTINGSVFSGGDLIIEKGGMLVVNGYLCGNSGTIQIAGSYEGNYIHTYYSTVTGVPNGKLWMHYVVNTAEELQAAVTKMNSTNYGMYSIQIHDSMTLPCDLTIPSNGYLVLEGQELTLTIPANRRLISNGYINMYAKQTVENYGTIQSNGGFSLAGKMCNWGSVTIGSSGHLYNEGTWEGNDPVYTAMTQKDLEAAIAQATANGQIYTLLKPVVLERNLTLKKYFQIGAGGHLVVPENVKLTINEGLEVFRYGTLEVQGKYELMTSNDGVKSMIGKFYRNGNDCGTVIGVADEDIALNCYVYPNESTLEEVLPVVQNSYGRNFIYIYTDATLSQDAVIPANCFAHLYDGASLTVEEGCTLVNNGEFYVWNPQTLNNYGTIQNNRLLCVFGTLNNYGRIDLAAGSTLVVENTGKACNEGTVDSNTLDVILLGTWEGNDIISHCITQAELEKKIAEAAKTGGTVTLTQTVTLEKNLTVPETVSLFISGGSIVVPKGITLTLKAQRVDVYKGSILVQEGGKLDLRTMIFMGYNGVVSVEGEFKSAGEGYEVVNFYQEGLTPCTVTGVPMENRRLYVNLRDQEEFWLPGIELFENNEYGRAFLEILSDVTLPKDLTVPENGYLLISGVAEKLTIPEGMTLTNHGVLRVDEAKSLYNYGTIENYGHFYVRANLFNYGTVEMFPGSAQESVLVMPEWGYVQNKGEVIFHMGSRLDQHENSVWNGNDPVWNYITQDQLEAEIAAAGAKGEAYELTTGVALERNLTVKDCSLNIGTGGHLIVPKGVTLTLNNYLHVYGDGILDIQGTYKTGTNARGYRYTVGRNYDDGSFSGTVIGVAEKDQTVNYSVYSEAELQNTLAHLGSHGYYSGHLYINRSMTLPVDTVIPANCRVHLYNGAVVTVPQGGTLVNNGEFYVWAGQTLQNCGTIENNEGIFVHGTLRNDGMIYLSSNPRQDAWNSRIIINTGSMVNNGTVNMDKNSYIEMFGTWEGSHPNNNGGRLLPAATAVTIEGEETRTVDIRGGSTTLQVTVATENLLAKRLTWTSSNAAIVDPSQITDNGDGTYTVPLLGTGKVKLTATTVDGQKKTDSVTLVVEKVDWSPRIGSTSITVNPKQEAGTQVALVTRYSNEITGYRLEDDRFQTAYDPEQGILTITPDGNISNSTVNTNLHVVCEDGEVYSYKLRISVKNTVPAITVKQPQKLDLFYTDSSAELTVTAKDAVVEAVVLDENTTGDFVLEDGILRVTDVFIQDYRENPKLKPDTKATLLIYLAGYREPVTKDITIGTTTSRITLTTDPASSTISTALSQDLRTSFHIYNKTAKANLALSSRHIQTVDAAFVEDWNVETDGTVSLTVASGKGGSANIYVRMDNWMHSVKVTHRVTLNTTIPTVKLASSTLKLSSVFSQQIAETTVSLSHSNLALAGFGSDDVFTSTAKEGSSTWNEAAKLRVWYDGEKIVAKIADPENAPKAGTYSFSAIPVVGDTKLKAVTVRVNVNAAVPTAKLSGSSVKLNTLLTGEETAELKVTLNNRTGYDLTVTGFKGMDAYQRQVEMRYSDGSLYVKMLTNREGKYPYQLIPIVTDGTGTTAELAPVKLTVQSYEKEVAVSQSAKGKLDTINRSSTITYTVSQITNALGKVEKVELAEGEHLFILSELGVDAKGKQIFALSLRDDVVYSTKETYQIRFRYTICGREVLSKVIKLKVTQSSLKLTAPAVTYYQAQNLPVSGTVSLTAPAGAKLGTVSINPDKTAKELLAAIGDAAITVSADGRTAALNLTIQNPGKLTAGRSYKLVLDIIPEGHASDAKPTQVTVTIKTVK